MMWTLGYGDHLTDPHAPHPVLERVAVDLVTIAEEIGGRGIVREGVHDLLSRPGGGQRLGDVEVEDSPAMVGEHDQASTRRRTVGTVKKSIETRSWT